MKQRRTPPPPDPVGLAVALLFVVLAILFALFGVSCAPTPNTTTAMFTAQDVLALLTMAILFIVVRQLYRWLKHKRTAPRWKFEGEDHISAMHHGYRLNVWRNDQPAGPWQTWNWSMSESIQKGSRTLTYGAGKTSTQAMKRAIHCAEVAAVRKEHIARQLMVP